MEIILANTTQELVHLRPTFAELIKIIYFIKWEVNVQVSRDYIGLIFRILYDIDATTFFKVELQFLYFYCFSIIFMTLLWHRCYDILQGRITIFVFLLFFNYFYDSVYLY